MRSHLAQLPGTTWQEEEEFLLIFNFESSTINGIDHMLAGQVLFRHLRSRRQGGMRMKISMLVRRV